MDWRSIWSYLQRSDKASAPVPMPAERRQTPPVQIQTGRGRPSWNLGDSYLLNNPFTRVPLQQNYALLKNLREAIPIVDIGVVKLRQYVGCPMIEAATEQTSQEITAFLGALAVNRSQIGWENWVKTFVDDLLLYGRSHTEIILNRARRDIYALAPLSPRTISLRPSSDRYSVEVVQHQATSEPILLPPLLMLNAYHDIREDDPNGTPLLWGLPFVGELYVRLAKALGGTWDRFGTPSFHVNWEPPDDFADSDGSKSRAIVDDIATQFNTAMNSRAEQDVRDFFSSGKITVSVIGAEGEALDIEAPARTLAEQIVAKTGLPPMVFGLQWATTERMSVVQAALLREQILAIRHEITPAFEYLIDLRQLLAGGDRMFKLRWSKPTLLDEFDTNRADFVGQQALGLRLKNGLEMWRNGTLDRWDFARMVRPEFDELPNEEIDRRLPDLPTEPPAAPTALEDGFGAAGSGTEKPNPFLRSFFTDQLVYGYGAGNGRHG